MFYYSLVVHTKTVVYKHISNNYSHLIWEPGIQLRCRGSSQEFYLLRLPINVRLVYIVVDRALLHEQSMHLTGKHFTCCFSI